MMDAARAVMNHLRYHVRTHTFPTIERQQCSHVRRVCSLDSLLSRQAVCACPQQIAQPRTEGTAAFGRPVRSYLSIVGSRLDHITSNDPCPQMSYVHVSTEQASARTSSGDTAKHAHAVAERETCFLSLEQDILPRPLRAFRTGVGLNAPSSSHDLGARAGKRPRSTHSGGGGKSCADTRSTAAILGPPSRPPSELERAQRVPVILHARRVRSRSFCTPAGQRADRRLGGQVGRAACVLAGEQPARRTGALGQNFSTTPHNSRLGGVSLSAPHDERVGPEGYHTHTPRS
ncbi:hypothetical protein BD413DRAFT_161130 [Trametes elegans]|nr:hypothetical protein BD413DRAFT_161130 [Trametes elegans]